MRRVSGRGVSDSSKEIDGFDEALVRDQIPPEGKIVDKRAMLVHRCMQEEPGVRAVELKQFVRGGEKVAVAPPAAAKRLDHRVDPERGLVAVLRSGAAYRSAQRSQRFHQSSPS